MEITEDGADEEGEGEEEVHRAMLCVYPVLCVLGLPGEAIF